MSEWKLIDLCIGKGKYGIAAPSVPKNDNLPTYLRITDINDDGTINKASLCSVDDENSTNYILVENDIVFARTGNSTGRSYFYNKNDGELVYAGFLIKFSLNPNIVNPVILKYYTHSKPYYDWIYSFDTGATRGNINAQTYANMPVILPERDIQDIIVPILSSLDAKIETNNKLNEKLEEMAQAIFKSWFVDFEPFKDQQLHETEIGYIPQIFESGVLGDLCTFKRGKGLLSKDAIPGDVPVIAGGMKPACYHNVANTKAPVVTVSGSGANAGYTQIHNVDVWASDCSFIDSKCENLYYAYCFLSRRPKLLKHSQTGAAQPHVKPADIHRFQVVIPPKEIINDFQQTVKPLFDRIGMNKIENDRLASLRDTLLPRLMSGEIKI
ncbi:MAG: restriction endonuclease subunit S [Prevotella sp.]